MRSATIAGHFSIRPAGDGSADCTATRRYLDATLVLETTFETPTGTLVVTDALATGAATDPHRLGAAAPRLLIRAVECTGGEVSASMEQRVRQEVSNRIGNAVRGSDAILRESDRDTCVVMPGADKADKAAL